VFLTVFFNQGGIVHHEFAPEGHKIKKEYYLQVLWHLLDAICCKEPEKWLSGH
jgi:hypothetical protein